jgi:HD-like signal output (HDOD) protein
MVSCSFSETEFILVAQELPASPRLLIELGQVIRNPQADSRDVVALLRQDGALVSRLIRMANSPVYARAEPAGSLEEALASIGFQEVHRLVGVVAATQLADQQLKLYGFDGGKLRANALFTAVVMEQLAAVADEDPPACYTVGLLRSIGKMALDRLAREDLSVQGFAASGEPALDEWEQKTWGTDNCRVAEHILLHWRLPADTVVSIRHHYHPEKRHNPIIHLLNLAAGAAEHRLFGLPGEEGYWKFTPENFAKAGLTERKFQEVCEHAQRSFNRLHSVVA